MEGHCTKNRGNISSCCLVDNSFCKSICIATTLYSCGCEGLNMLKKMAKLAKSPRIENMWITRNENAEPSNDGSKFFVEVTGKVDL